MRNRLLLANIALLGPVLLYLLSLVLQQFTKTMWWYTHIWDPLSDFMLGYAFFGLPFVALAIIFSTPAMGLFTRIVKVLLWIGFSIFIVLHLFFLVQFGTPFPSDMGAGIVSFLFLMVFAPIFFFGSLVLSIFALQQSSNEA